MNKPLPDSTQSPLTEADKELIRSICSESRVSFVGIGGIILGATLLIYFKDSPIALERFQTIPGDQTAKLPYAAVRNIHYWFLGLYFLFGSIHGLFFERRRRLIAKLAFQTGLNREEN